jgi:hypothetical protein
MGSVCSCSSLGSMRSSSYTTSSARIPPTSLSCSTLPSPRRTRSSPWCPALATRRRLSWQPTSPRAVSPSLTSSVSSTLVRASPRGGVHRKRLIFLYAGLNSLSLTLSLCLSLSICLSVSLSLCLFQDSVEALNTMLISS